MPTRKMQNPDTEKLRPACSWTWGGAPYYSQAEFGWNGLGDGLRDFADNGRKERRRKGRTRRKKNQPRLRVFTVGLPLGVGSPSGTVRPNPSGSGDPP